MFRANNAKLRGWGKLRLRVGTQALRQEPTMLEREETGAQMPVALTGGSWALPAESSPQ